MAAIRQIFERVRASYGECRGTWIAADFEAWERDHTVITEFGFAELKWSPVDDRQQSPSTDAKPQNGTRSSVAPKARGDQQLRPVITRTGHWIVKENQSYRNGEFCQDNRDVRTHGYFSSDLLTCLCGIAVRIWAERNSVTGRLHPSYTRTHPTRITG